MGLPFLFSVRIEKRLRAADRRFVGTGLGVVGVAGVTVSPVEPMMPSTAAEIVTEPGDTAVASPAPLIVAHVVSEEAQVTWLVRFWVEWSDRVPDGGELLGVSRWEGWNWPASRRSTPASRC